VPTIRIDNELWNFLKKRAEPFEDTPNTVLRRLLRLDKKERIPKRPRGDRTPQPAYRAPILHALDELGGRAKAEEVLKRVARQMKGAFKPADLEKISSGMLRWRNAAMWERKAMVDDGLLAAGSPRGIWELAPRGRESLGSSAA
jgi:restriction system protein